MPSPEDETNAKNTPSRWEWLPVILLPVLVITHQCIAEPGGMLSRFTLFIGLSLIPGSLLRLAGKSSRNTHRVFFAAGLTAFVLENPALRPDRESWNRIREHWPLVAFGFALSATQTIFGTLRTHRLLTDSGVEITRRDTLRLCLVGSFFNIFLPGSNGGDAYRVYALTSGYKAKLAPAIASVTLDRLLGLPPLMLIVIAGMTLDYDFFRTNRLLSGLSFFLIAGAAGCAALVCYLAFAGGGREGGTEEKTGWLRRIHAMVTSNVTRRSTLPVTLLQGFVSHVACIVSCLAFGIALGMEGVSPLRYFLIVPVAMTINAVPGAPGGVGQGELAMATLFDMAAPGTDNARVGVMVMLLFRLSCMAVGLLGGVCYATGKTGRTGKKHGD